ncbi:hypothetical protein [Kangiella sp.]|uniref:hypothetical protein n=1 Tax=Kangiella sp. TaxID=1920245 RepID=UPI003A917827
MTQPSEQKVQQPEVFKLSPIALLLDIIGMALVVFAGYEIYMNNEQGGGLLMNAISWPYYPWVIMVAGVLLMIPFHKQIFKAYRIVKQYKKEQAKADRPRF